MCINRSLFKEEEIKVIMGQFCLTNDNQFEALMKYWIHQHLTTRLHYVGQLIDENEKTKIIDVDQLKYWKTILEKMLKNLDEGIITDQLQKNVFKDQLEVSLFLKTLQK